jgi:hypothetical protein
MRTYYPSLEALHRQTLQLESESCRHCRQTQQLVSHGFIRKKRTAAEPEAVGKRVFCSNRGRRTGCGRTMQLYLDATVRTLHHAASSVAAFVLSLLTGFSVERAYRNATGAASARHAWRWLQRLDAQLAVYRSRCHQPILAEMPEIPCRPRSARRGLLMSTFAPIAQQFGPQLCQAVQAQWQRPFF